MTQNIPFVPLAAMGSIVFTFINFLKFLTAKDWVPARTQATVWIAGIAGANLFAHSDFGNAITIGSKYLDNMSEATLVIIGLSASSLFSFATQGIKAVDRTQSAALPPLSVKQNNELRSQTLVGEPMAMESTAGRRPLDWELEPGRVMTMPAHEAAHYTAEMAAAVRAGWNPDDGPAPYPHTPEPPDALVATTPVPVTEVAVAEATPERPAPPGVVTKVQAKPRKRKAAAAKAKGRKR